ncbi:STAS domain-containing protein [Streptomyces sp. NPDC059945]|uniref:STAS domain-containing protein n=1 Tax=unclassified Streptomyces TaxID=2593676 RepID=UPI00364EBB76
MTEQPAPSARLGITSRVVDGVSVVSVSGEIDYSSGDQFHQALTTVRTEPPVRTVVDLGGVTFMDSSGLGAIIATYRSAQDSNGWIRIAAPTEPVLRVMQIIGLDTIIDCYPSSEQALNAAEQ